MAITYELKIHGIEQNPSDFVARSYASEVQHVGFRDKIENLGHALGIDGIVYNYKDGTVRILANFDDEELKEMFKMNIKFLEKKDNLINIDEIEEKELKTFIEFPSGINRISADDLLELNKKLDEGVKYIKMIFRELGEHKEILIQINSKLDNMNNKLDGIDSKLDNMNDKLDSIDNKLDNINSKLDKLDDMNNKLDKLVEILEKIEKKL
jgi:acylphosphatase